MFLMNDANHPALAGEWWRGGIAGKKVYDKGKPYDK